jgi:hypothetical protein
MLIPSLNHVQVIALGILWVGLLWVALLETPE